MYAFVAPPVVKEEDARVCMRPRLPPWWRKRAYECVCVRGFSRGEHRGQMCVYVRGFSRGDCRGRTFMYAFAASPVVGVDNAHVYMRSWLLPR